ncbi:MAG: ABC transporter permease, partial [Bacteroidales bacterium]|nr:ABC transporter permease [Bacteroidales bacterium]
MRLLYHLGRYYILISKVFARPERSGMYYRQIMRELEIQGINSIGIVVIISIFVGAVITIQTDYNIESPLLPRYLIGVGVRDMLLLEFSSTMVALILAGKVGSSIASELGTMRITEQIDALEIMGVNSASFLILPKIISTMFFFPLLTILSLIVGMSGGYVVALITDVSSPQEFVYGLQYVFYPYYFTYALKKMIVFAFIITTISAYHGYYAEGSSL